MAVTIATISLLQEYLAGVIARAEHHAPNVAQIALALIGGVIWKATGDIEVREYKGRPANILWMPVNDKRYCFMFNHNTWIIEVRESSSQGKTLATFDNNTPLVDVMDFFKKM